MNIYQHLINMGKVPDECVGRSAVTVFRSKAGSLGVGLYGKMLSSQGGNPKAYRPIYRTRLEVDMLGITADHLLYVVAQLHRLAEERGIEVRGEEI